MDMRGKSEALQRSWIFISKDCMQLHIDLDKGSEVNTFPVSANQAQYEHMRCFDT